MPLKKNCIFCLILLLLQVKYAYQSEIESPFRWELGEELVYNVKWTFIKVGELRLQVIQKDTLHSRSVYHCRIKIDSSPGLFLIRLHDIYESYVDAEEFYSHRFRSYENKGAYILFTEINYHPDSQWVKIRIEEQQPDHTKIVLDTTMAATAKIQDSLSLLYFARAMAKFKMQSELAVLIYQKFEFTHLNVAGLPVRIEWQGRDIFAYPLNGQLKFVGVAGLKGDYWGWFSADSQSVPLKASMKAFIGSIKIELKEWKKWKAG